MSTTATKMQHTRTGRQARERQDGVHRKQSYRFHLDLVNCEYLDKLAIERGLSRSAVINSLIAICRRRGESI